MDTITLIGSSGAALILLAFIQNQRKRWKHTDFVYDFVNLAGSLLLCVYAWLLSSWPFLILNGVWLLISLKDVLKFFIQRRT